MGGQRGACVAIESKQRTDLRKRRNLSYPCGEYGLWGGYVPMIVDTLVFDNAQITSKLNYSHPTWGGNVTHLQAQPDKQ